MPSRQRGRDCLKVRVKVRVKVRFKSMVVVTVMVTLWLGFFRASDEGGVSEPSIELRATIRGRVRIGLRHGYG